MQKTAKKKWCAFTRAGEKLLRLGVIFENKQELQWKESFEARSVLLRKWSRSAYSREYEYGGIKIGAWIQRQKSNKKG